MRQDPVEAIVESALAQAGISYVRDVEVSPQGPNGPRLDFYLPDAGVYIECKQMYTERITKQIALVQDVIVIQGLAAALVFSNLIEKGKP